MAENTEVYISLRLALVITKIADYYAITTEMISQASEGIGILTSDIVLARLQLDTFKNMILRHPAIVRPAILSVVWRGVTTAQKDFQHAADRFEITMEKAKRQIPSLDTAHVVDISEPIPDELFKLYREYFLFLSLVPVMGDAMVPDLPSSLLFDGLSLAPFVYTDLTSPKDTIRLVKMVSISEDLWSPICVSTRTVNFRDGVQYATLSYTWSNAHGIFSSEADSKADTRHDIPIICDGQVINIGENLYRFLCRWRQALANFEQMPNYISGGMSDRAPIPQEFWIDAICINQKNDEEKNSQVSVMGDIYTHSQRTWIWLGENDVFSRSALEVIQTIGNKIINKNRNTFQRKTQLDMEALLRELDLPDPFSWKWFALFAFFQRQWFRRSWVIQEAVLSSQIEFLCGSILFPWTLLTLTSTFLIESGIFQHVHSIGNMEMQAGHIEPNLKLGSGALLKWSDQRLFNPIFYSRVDPDPDAMALVYRITSLKKFDTTIESKDTSSVRPVGDIDPIAMLLELWRLSRKNMCFDARDKVFACASLANKDIYRTPDTIATRRQLLPDYKKSVSEVYQEAAWFTLLTHPGLQILSMTGHTAHHNTLYPVLGSRSFAVAEISWSLADRDGAVEDRVVCGWELALEDTAANHVIRALLDGSSRLCGYEFFLEIAPTYTDLNAGQDLYDIIWRTVIANFADDASPAASTYALEFEKAYLKEVTQARNEYLAGNIDAAIFTNVIDIMEKMKDIGWLRGDWKFMLNASHNEAEETPDLESRIRRLIGNEGDDPPELEEKTSEKVEFETRVTRTLIHRKLFFTALGYVGVGDLNVEFGDSIVVMAGSPVPFVVREGTDGRYRLVGEAYVDGIMFGEVVEGGAEWEEVMLE